MLKIILTLLLSATAVVAATPNWDEEHSDKPYIALVNEYDVTVNDDYSYDEVYHARVKVQQPDAADLGQWPVYYNKSREQIVDIKAYTEDPAGKKTEATVIEDSEVYVDAPAFGDMRVKVIKLPDVAVGNIIDVTIKSKTLTKEIPKAFWHTVPLPVIPTKVARYVYSFPTGLPIKFSAYHNDTKPVITEKSNRITYTFVLENTAYNDEEDYMPPADEVDGVLSFSSIDSWDEVAAWYREQIIKASEDDADISVKTLELIKDKTTAKDKTRAIIEFLQDNFKYVAVSPSDHGAALHSTKTVFANKYGDAKDLSVLARQMLAIAGIKANICLFSGEFNGNPQNSLPNPNVFDHLILQVELDGQQYYLDPQAKGFDIGQLASSYDNAHVFIIADKEAHFDEMPVNPETSNLVESSSDITVSEDGSAVFDVKVSLPLEASVQFKQQWVGSSKEQQEKFFEQLQTNFTPGGKMLDRQITGVNERYGNVSFTLKYQAPNAYPIVNDMILLKEADQSNLTQLPDGKRRTAILFPTNSLVKNTNTYRFPDTFNIDSLPQAYDLNNEFMQVIVGYKKDGNSVTAEALYRTKRALLDPSRYDEVKKFRDELLKKNDQYVVLKRKSNISADAKDWIKKQ